MSLFDMFSGPSLPEGYVEMENNFECPSCGIVSTNCFYNRDKGEVLVVCDEGHNDAIYIGVRDFE